jgi:hypothetical protein
MCKGNPVNVIFNSNNKASGTNNDAKFYIDWSAILKDRTAYKLHWTYVGMPNTFTIATKLAQVRCNFITKAYGNQAGNNGAQQTQAIGFLRTFYLNGTINYLFADDGNNPDIYMESRPMDNNVNIQIYNTDATPTAWTDSAGTPVVPNNWVLTLSFTEVEN